jgi:hypothetical protein
MLEPAISKRRRWRVTWKHVACASAFGCATLAMQALLDRPAEVRIELPAPPVVVAIPAPPVVVIPPAPPPAPPPSPPAPPPVLEAHAGCAADVATIGVPMAQAPADPNAPPIVEVAVSREGCTLAARTASTIAVSFDGGRSFARTELSANQMAAAIDRVMLLDHQLGLGTMLPGHATVWRALPTAVPEPKLFAAGKWTVLANGKLAALSDDNGDSWRYVELPANVAVARLEANGHLYGTSWKAVVEPDGMTLPVYTNTRYVADVAHPHWRALDTNPGTPADETGRYVLEGDKFWGCGSSQKLELAAGGRATEVAGDLRDEVWPIRVHTNAGVTFASLSNQLERVDGATRVQLGDIPGELVGVDANATPIVHAYSQLLRWSKAGGWRVLL